MDKQITAKRTLILRLTMAMVLLSHALPGMFDGGVNAFGDLYLNQVGFAPVGVAIAWATKLSHVLCALLFLLNRYIWVAALTTIFVLIAGIVMVHAREGWFVIGGGRNGMEYNIVLILVVLAILFPEGTGRKPAAG